MPHRKARAEDDRPSRLHRGVPLAATAKEAGRTTGGQAGPGWTLVLRGQPIRIVDGQARGGYTDVFELICCDCGDDPDLDYRDVSPELQQIRGPLPDRGGHRRLEEEHVVWHQTRQATRPGESSAARGRL